MSSGSFLLNTIKDFRMILGQFVDVRGASLAREGGLSVEVSLLEACLDGGGRGHGTNHSGFHQGGQERLASPLHHHAC